MHIGRGRHRKCARGAGRDLMSAVGFHKQFGSMLIKLSGDCRGEALDLGEWTLPRSIGRFAYFGGHNFPHDSSQTYPFAFVHCKKCTNSEKMEDNPLLGTQTSSSGSYHLNFRHKWLPNCDCGNSGNDANSHGFGLKAWLVCLGVSALPLGRSSNITFSNCKSNRAIEARRRRGRQSQALHECPQLFLAALHGSPCIQKTASCHKLGCELRNVCQTVAWTVY